MQGGGQFHTIHGTAGMDALQQRTRDEMRAARRASQARRHRARHRGGHFGWLRLGRGHAAAHGPETATARPAGDDAHHGSSHGESHGY